MHGDILHCSERESVCKALITQHGNLEGVYEYLVGVINKATVRKTTMVNQVLSTELRCFYSNEFIKISPPEEDVLEIPEGDWIKIFGYDRSVLDAFAVYLPSDGKIYLRKDEWCLCNFVHETLHSRSVLSRKDGPYRNLKFAYEGITELLTGWLLHVEFPNCFSVWSKLETCFLKSYERWVKMWNYFSWKIGIQGMVDIYFDCNLTDPLQTLVELAVGKNYDIQNVFSSYEAYTDLESRCVNELSRSFGTDFDEYMSSDIRLLQPGKI
jgi:hypothetical protein